MRQWIGIGAAATVALALLPFVGRKANADDALARSAPAAVKTVSPPPLTGVDLTRIEVHDREAIAPAANGRVAHLTLDPELQRAAHRIVHGYKLPEAAVVLIETATGRVLVWESKVDKGPPRDVCVEASAPAASVFKIVTGSALVEDAGLGPDTKQCYSGGENRIHSADLVDDPKRDKWCATLAEAMGRSINTVFARLALKKLDATKIAAMAGAYGFGDAVPFDVPTAPSTIRIPKDELGFARTAAGFWNTTLSPLEAITMVSTVANGGETVRPVIVASVTDGANVLYEAPERQVVRHAIKQETAAALTTMLEATVASGTSYRAFHDSSGKPFLPNLVVAGKTGTLTRAETQQYYTWFAGFAPSRAPEVAVAVLVVNHPTWRVKANVVARDVLRAYFAKKGAPGVTKP
jgi:peptidoglycan glycosyltransferase